MLITNSPEDTDYGKSGETFQTVGFAAKVGNTGISVIRNKPSGI
jgi:hypothetical protein